MQPNRFIAITALALASAVALAAPPALAQMTPLMTPLTPSIKVVSSPEGTTVGLGNSGPSNVPAKWMLAQWGIPENLQPAVGAAVPWTIQNGYGRVSFFGTDPADSQFSNVYELAQAGNVCGVERDMFLSSSSDDPTAAGFTRSAALNQIGSLYGSTILRPQYFSTTADCANAYGQYAFSLILSSAGGNGYPAQTLFYQINVGRNAPIAHNTNVGWCPGYDDAATQEFCADDDVRSMNTGFFVAGTSGGQVDFDALPRLKEIIASNHEKVGAGAGIRLDPDLSHWTIGSAYVGEILQGKTVSTTRWSDIKLNQYAGGTFCGGGKAVQYICNASPPNAWGWGDAGGGCYHRQTQNACTP